mmetsp:Transcript_16003/g.23536  ORF Transcript_16003/g.23536 Transcript_16003/m.23536 type:complete len:521 (-) Transcript_16003:133-1695(-)|eukprot:CAMPEP_0194200212 /NCGR_PEP_ID=MMETSP0156-20130528/917_1 /TAXON_ID=33649 /ORGANISM="Thalassionema nitzschioides, Strain L26-B" /LENGTH=520 /DNA_ID=CAMNT_0038925185 /DNA_START=95 /DNA_END=1657 /DNA_ORIENTATION=-
MMFRLSAALLLLLSGSSNNNYSVNAQCSVCGENKEVTKGDAIFEFEGQPSVPCGMLQVAGESGLVPLDDCQFLPDLLTMCGCAPVGGGEVETPAPVVPATPEPTPIPATPEPTPVQATPEPTADPTPVPVTPDPTPEVVPETAAPVPETPAPVVPEPAVPATTPETAPTPKFTPEETVPETPAPVEESTPAPYEEEEAESTPADDDDDDNNDDSEEEETPNVTIPEVTTPDDLTTAMLAGGFYCGQDVADSQTNCDQPCLTNADCDDEGNNNNKNYCWGSWNYCSTDPSNPSYTPPSGKVIPEPDLPTALEAISDYRCGISEVDARSNCGKLCTTNADCNDDEHYCWGTHANYCHLKPEPHPRCDPARAEQTARRCGGDEESARSFCGLSCNDETDCSVPGEWCFPVQLNLCACFEEQDDFNALLLLSEQQQGDVALDGQKIRSRQLVSVSNRQYFDDAKQPLEPYFLEAYETYEQQQKQAAAAGALRGNSAAAGIRNMSCAAVVVVMMMAAGVAGLVLY